MKKFIYAASCIVLTWILFAVSCKKDSSKNRAPLALTAPDFSIELPSCNARTGTIVLDGTGSTDPDNNITFYRWAYISGPEGYILSDQNSAKAKVSNLSAGEYIFQLYVNDAHGKNSSDKIRISVKGKPEEYDIDITFNSIFSFLDNSTNCSGWYYYYYNCYEYFDLTFLNGTGNFPQIGEFTLNLTEQADSSDSGSAHDTQIQMYFHDINSKGIWGTCSVNFKQIIKRGGGAFSGEYTITSGTAETCGAVLTDLPPLSVTGTLDLTTYTAILRIRGKVYF